MWVGSDQWEKNGMNSAELEPLAEKALWMLRNDAQKHGQDRANADHMESYVKIVKAQIMGRSTATSIAAAESEAMRADEYLKALEAKKTADEAHYTNQYKREAGLAFIEAWRTVCSNERADGKVK